MFSKSSVISAALAFTVFVFLMSALAYADPAATANNSTGEPEQTVVAPPPAENPSDGRALSQDEVAAFQTLADSAARNPQVQQMNVGADVNWTIVLSVLVALLIFAIVVSVL